MQLYWFVIVHLFFLLGVVETIEIPLPDILQRQIADLKFGCISCFILSFYMILKPYQKHTEPDWKHLSDSYVFVFYLNKCSSKFIFIFSWSVVIRKCFLTTYQNVCCVPDLLILPDSRSVFVYPRWTTLIKMLTLKISLCSFKEVFLWLTFRYFYQLLDFMKIDFFFFESVTNYFS